jgi:hypothetical protein
MNNSHAGKGNLEGRLGNVLRDIQDRLRALERRRHTDTVTVVESGTNTTVTGSGTAADPYTVNAEAGVEYSTDPGNTAVEGTDGGIYVPPVTYSADAGNIAAPGTDGGIFVPPSTGAGVVLDALLKQGPVGIATDVFPSGIRVPANFTTARWDLRCNTAHVPTGSACTVAVKRVGVTIATVSIAAGASTGTVSTAVALVLGDILHADVTAAGSTTPAYDLALQVS